MRVRIYGQSEGDIEDVDFIRHVNAVEGLTINDSADPSVTLEIQAQQGQTFVLGGRFLSCYQSGHEVIEDGASVVYPVEPPNAS